MNVKVLTKYGDEIHKFAHVDEIREAENYYEITMEDDRPWCRVYGKNNVIVIKY